MSVYMYMSLARENELNNKQKDFWIKFLELKKMSLAIIMAQETAFENKSFWDVLCDPKTTKAVGNNPF